VEFEPTITVFDRVKTVDALDRAAAVVGFHAVLGSLIPGSCSLLL
jgi:hypothetical protein